MSAVRGTLAAVALIAVAGARPFTAAAQAQDAAPPAVPAQPSDAAPAVRPLALDLTAMRKALSSVPALAGFAAQFVPFTQADADAALKRGGRSRGSVSVWTFLPAAFAWTPVAGRELWVLSGRSGARALVAVLERKGAGFEHAASTVLDEPDATVAIGHSAQYPGQLVWSSCYGCAGEGGTILSRDDGRIEFAYR